MMHRGELQSEPGRAPVTSRGGAWPLMLLAALTMLVVLLLAGAPLMIGGSA